jgi:acyl-CoA reductase-like NAD-dependent aldehyde dehydrogenase
MGKYATINPATGEVVQGFDTMSDADADQALTRAHEAYLDWRNIELKERAAILGRVADLFRQNATALAELTTLEMGKPITQAKGEVELSAAIFEYYATKGPDLLADETLDIAGAGKAIVRTAPIGALLGIMPWNFPYYQAARFVAPNLLLGNTILLKHAANCPQQALRLAELLEVAGAPPGVYQRVRHHRPSRDDARQPTVAGHFADRLRTGRQRGGRARRPAPQESSTRTRRIRPVHRAARRRYR